MQNIKLNVEGMSCSHCENSIKSALKEISGISEVFVNLAEKTVEISFENIDLELIKKTIEEQGFDIIE